VSVTAARPLSLEPWPGRMPAAEPVQAFTALTRREASLRSAAVVCLVGIALVQVIGLPSLLAQGGRLAALSAAAAALCLGGGIAAAAAPARASRPLWRAVAAVAALVLAGWAVPHAVALPDQAGARGDWASMRGGACGALAVVCLGLAAAGIGPSRATARGLATALVVLVALAPGAGAVLVALGPGPAGGEAAIAADVHVHAHSTAREPDIRVRRGRGGNHYLTRVAAAPRTPALGVASAVAAAGVFLCGAVGCLHRRSTPVRPVAAPRLEGRPA
jgi:hypothetical protein